MDHVIRNEWTRAAGSVCSVAKILSHDVHPEGFDVRRLHFVEDGRIALDSSVAHIVTVLSGAGTLSGKTDREPITLGPGVHLYLPNGEAARLAMHAGSQLIDVAAGSAVQQAGTRRLVRDEQFLSAMAHGERSLRWVLTPQYLSRRVFLHHDQTLTSKSARHVSWFRTTMFDVKGLPPNAEGESVFKMSYNYRTEFNVCYETSGEARVRFAQDPYVSDDSQRFGAWRPIDGESTYCLHETDDRRGDSDDEAPRRNKHEVYISGGAVSLCCLFDPAPTGTERHRPGQYSDYGPLTTFAAITDVDAKAVERMKFDGVEDLERLLETDSYRAYLDFIAPYDEMVNLLSELKARGRLDQARESAPWHLYLAGRAMQQSIEARLAARLAAEGHGRDRTIAPWRLR